MRATASPTASTFATSTALNAARPPAAVSVSTTWVVLRDPAKIGLGDRRHLTALVQKTDDHGRLLHRLNDGIEQHTIEARVLKADAPLVVLDERVRGGTPYEWVGQFPS